MTVRELGRRMDATEFAYWMELEAIDPLPDPYWVGGLVCHVLESLWSKKARGIMEFLPWHEKPAPVQRSMPFAHMAAIVRGAIASAEARLLRRNPPAEP